MPKVKKIHMAPAIPPAPMLDPRAQQPIITAIPNTMRAFSDKTLGLSRSLEMARLENGTLLIKQLRQGEYMAFTPAQWAVIGSFDGKHTVGRVLQALLHQGGFIGIRPFYDLVLSAWTKGILEESGTSAEQAGGILIRSGLRPRVLGSLLLSMAAVAMGGLAFLQTDIAFQYRPLDWLQLACFVSLGISLSYALAGAELSSLGRNPGAMKIRWDRGLPFMHVNTRDAFMGGRLCEVAVAMRGLAAPFLLAVVAVLVESNNGLLGSGFAMLVVGCPFGATFAHNLLHALFRNNYELPRCAEKFLRTKLVTQILSWKQNLSEERYLMTYSAYAITWIGVAFHYASEVFGMLLRRSRTGENELFSQVILSLNIAVVALAMAGIITFALYVAFRAAHRHLAPRLMSAEKSTERHAVDGRRPSDEVLESFLKTNLLFSQLPPAMLKDVLPALKFISVEAGRTIIRERDIGDRMFIVFAGRVEVFQELESGHERRVATLGPGDAFGEIALLDDLPRTGTVRSVEQSDLLALGKEDFQRLLVSELGAEQIRETIQVCAFLRRNPLFADWHPQALIAVANRFTLQQCAKGARLLAQGGENDAFYLIHDGEFEVVRNGKRIATLQSGDFAGEISLLKNTTATADVIALRDSRCLQIGREDFIRFISHDFLTGMAIEQTLQARLMEAVS